LQVCLQNLGIHGPLQREYVTRVSLVAISPKVFVRRAVDELRGDAHAIAGALHGSFDDPVHVQLASDFGQRLLGVMTDLGVVPGDVGSFAFGLNDRGEVVGGSYDQNGNARAYLWQDGVMIDLNSLVKPGSTPLYLVFGNDINSRGEIAAYAFDQSNDEFHAAVAIPCDEQHAENEDCEDVAQATTAALSMASAPPKVTLPQNVQEQLRKRLGIGRFGPAR
jgi:probable HAF family extracellular repeat protein